MEHKQDYTKDGIYEIDYTANEGANKIYFYVVGGNIGQLENPITIEQLPLYPGALVFDGVDDYGTCDNFPILTKEKGYTVVALRRWLSLYEDNKYYTLLVNSNQRDKGAFAFEEFNNRSKGTFNFGNYAAFSSVNLSMPFTYQTSTSYNGKAIAIGRLKEGVNLFQVCKIGTNYCSKAAIWEIVILDHDATEEELTKIKDYFVKTYPWLFPTKHGQSPAKPTRTKIVLLLPTLRAMVMILYCLILGLQKGVGMGCMHIISTHLSLEIM